LIARAHQLAAEGFQWHFDGKLVTVWSAPNYMYRSGNRAAVMKLDENGEAEIVPFDAHEDSMTMKPDEVILGYFT
jgi:hypothetical protein